MPIAALEIIRFMLQFGIPALQQVVAIAHTESPTQEQWDALFKMASKSYDDYIKGPPSPTPPTTTPS